MDTYKDKNVWIIGASSGIGEALAREISAKGAHVILSARSVDKLNAINESLGRSHTVLPLDASDIDALSKAASGIKKLDSVVFLAALYAPHSDKPQDISFMHKMLSVNIGGVFNTVRATLPIFEEQGHGQIVLCGSVAGYRGLPYGQPYCATKAAIINYAESLKIELEPKNIDVKLINPGFVKTPLTDKNDFPMPMMIEVDDAARALAQGLLARGFEINFPKVFTALMRITNILPRWVYFPLARLMLKGQSS